MGGKRERGREGERERGREREREWHAARGPHGGIKPGAAAVRTQPLYMGHPLYQPSYQGALCFNILNTIAENKWSIIIYNMVWWWGLVAKRLKLYEPLVANHSLSPHVLSPSVVNLAMKAQNTSQISPKENILWYLFAYICMSVWAWLYLWGPSLWTGSMGRPCCRPSGWRAQNGASSAGPYKADNTKISSNTNTNIKSLLAKHHEGFQFILLRTATFAASYSCSRADCRRGFCYIIKSP